MTNNALNELIELIPKITSYSCGAIQGSPAVPDELLVFKTVDKNFPRKPSIHHRFMMGILKEGDVSISVDHQLHRLKAGQGIIIFPYQIHLCEDVYSDDIQFIHISFELQDASLFAGLRNAVFRLDEESWHIVENIIANFIAFRNGADVAGMKACLYGAILLTHLSNSWLIDIDDQHRIRADNDLLLKVTHYVNRHYTENISLADVAKNVCMSESHLRRVFKRQAKGFTLGDFIRRIRLYNAERFLSSTPLSVSEVAEKCGFSSIYSFSRAFKQFFGRSPSQFRTKIQKTYHRQ